MTETLPQEVKTDIQAAHQAHVNEWGCDDDSEKLNSMFYRKGLEKGAEIALQHTQEVKGESAELVKLRKFKKMVHDAFDDMGVPYYPMEECRVGARLGYVAAQIGRNDLDPLPEDEVDENPVYRCMNCDCEISEQQHTYNGHCSHCHLGPFIR